MSRWRRLITARSTWTCLTLTAGLVCGAALNTAGVMGKRDVNHDEAIAYLAATGHQSEYGSLSNSKSPPFYTWAKASECKRLIRVEDAFCFKRIGSDLARTDIHPPLYFWLLHVWCLLFGVHIWSGPALNALLDSLATVALFFLGRHVLRDSLAGALVAFVWSVSPNVILTTLEARPYGLLGLFTILFVSRVIRCSDPAQPCGLRQLAWLALVTAGGLLTHYHFPLLIIGGGLFTLVRLAKSHRWRLAVMCAAVAVGIAVFVAVHPGFSGSVQRGRRQAQAYGSRPVSERLHRVRTCYTAFYVDSTSLPIRQPKAVEYVVLAVIGAMLLKSCVSCYRKRSSVGSPEGKARAPGLWALYFLLWTAATNILLYVTFLTPRHGMWAKYPAMAWPFCAFIPILALHSLRKPRPILMAVVCVIMLTAGLQRVRETNRMAARLNLPTTPLESCQQLVVDTVRRGWLPRVLWYCPDDVDVFVAKQKFLLDRQDAWVDQLGPATLYVSPHGSRSTRTRRGRILDMLATRYRIGVAPGGFWDVGPGYWILPGE